MSQNTHICSQNVSNKTLISKLLDTSLQIRPVSNAFIPSYTSRFLYYMIETPKTTMFKPLVQNLKDILSHNEAMAYTYVALQKLGLKVEIERYINYKQLRIDFLALDKINRIAIAFEVKGKELSEMKELERSIGQLFLMRKIIKEIIVIAPRPLIPLIPKDIAPAIIALDPGTKRQKQCFRVIKPNQVTELYSFEDLIVNASEVDFMRFVAPNKPLWIRLKPIIIKTYKETKSTRKTAKILNVSRDVIRRAIADMPKDWLNHSEKTRALAIELYKKYWSSPKVAKILKVARQTVYHWVLKEIMAGNKTLEFIMDHTREFNDITKVRKAIKLQHTLSLPEIAKEVNTSIDTVRKWFKKLDHSPHLLQMVLKTGESNKFSTSNNERSSIEKGL